MSLLSTMTSVRIALALVKEVAGEFGTRFRIKRQKEKDAEIDKKGNVDKKELRKRLRG